MSDPDDKVVPLRPKSGKAELLELLRDSDRLPPNDPLSDEIVLHSETQFRIRFGLGFRWGERHRAALIQLKRRKDMTDPEIRLFRRTGSLRKTASGVKLTTSVWFAAWGSIQVLCLGLMFGPAVWAGWHNLVCAPVNYEAWLMLSGVAMFAYVLYWSQVKPWWISRHLRA